MLERLFANAQLTVGRRRYNTIVRQMFRCNDPGLGKPALLTLEALTTAAPTGPRSSLLNTGSLCSHAARSLQERSGEHMGADLEVAKSAHRATTSCSRKVQRKWPLCMHASVSTELSQNFREPISPPAAPQKRAARARYTIVSLFFFFSKCCVRDTQTHLRKRKIKKQ